MFPLLTNDRADLIQLEDTDRADLIQLKETKKSCINTSIIMLIYSSIQSIDHSSLFIQNTWNKEIYFRVSHANFDL